MGLLDRVEQRRRARGWIVGEAALDPWSGLTSLSGEKPFSPEEYGNYLATSNNVYACVQLRASNMAGIDLKLYRGSKSNPVEVETGPLRDLLDRVNPFWTFNRLMHMTEASLCLWGESFWFFDRGTSGDGEPKEIWWAKPTRVTPIRHPDRYIVGFEYRPAGGGDPLFFKPSEVLWLRYPNPLDEFAGLSPLAAARLAADVASAAAKSNRNLFSQGMQLGGTIMPNDSGKLPWTVQQAGDLEELFKRRFTGADRAHRWVVLREQIKMEQFGINPKDAEWLGALGWSLEEVARAYLMPLELLGGAKRTYENLVQARQALWELALKPEARFIQSEITEQVLPMFAGNADFAAFDLAEIEAMQEDENKKWQRVTRAYAGGLLGVETAHELLKVEFKPEDPRRSTLAAADIPEPDELEPVEEEPRRLPARAKRAVTFGSSEHRELAERFEQRAANGEKAMLAVVRSLLEEQQAAVITRLRSEGVSRALPADREPFDLQYWVDQFRRRGTIVLLEIVRHSGRAALKDLALAVAFDHERPEVIRFLAQRAQRFARQVNETTWNMLQASLADGVSAGESIRDLEKRIVDVMGSRIRSDAETIARTETLGAANGGTLEAWRQSGVVDRKAWLASLDGRERETHRSAHSRYQADPIPLEQDFQVGSASGPAPGQMGAAGEDINCRCTLIPIVAERSAPKTNGHRTQVGPIDRFVALTSAAADGS